MRRALCVSLDAVAATGAAARLPARLLAAASLAELAGADRIRIGVREELAPVGPSELRDLRRAVRQLELRIAPAPALLKIVLEVRPERVLLAAEPVSGHTAPPLDVSAWSAGLLGLLRTLREASIDAALLVAPTLDAVKAARGVDAPGVELATGALLDLPPRERREALVALGDAARLAAKLRLSVGLGGGLDVAALGDVLAAAPVVEWVSSGRGWAERALLVGAERAVRDWRERL